MAEVTITSSRMKMEWCLFWIGYRTLRNGSEEHLKSVSICSICSGNSDISFVVPIQIYCVMEFTNCGPESDE